MPKKRQARIRVTVLYGVEQENNEIGVVLSVINVTILCGNDELSSTMSWVGDLMLPDT